MKHIYSKEILEHHLDTLGHVNNATYVSLFEEARWQLVTERDYGLDYVQSSGKSPIILKIDIQFSKEVLNREKVEIHTELVEYKSKIGTLQQSLFKSSGELACKAIFIFGLFDLKERKLIEPTKEWSYAVGLEDSK